MDKRNEILLAVEMENFQLKEEISVLKEKFDEEKSQLKREMKEKFDENSQLKEEISQLKGKLSLSEAQLNAEYIQLKVRLTTVQSNIPLLSI